MFKIKIYTIGKTKERWLEEALEEYTQRLKATLSIEWVLAKDDQKLLELAQKEPLLLCLDPKGVSVTSEEFSRLFYSSLIQGGSRLAFVIGGAEGLPAPLKQKGSRLISLSPLTFTHQLTRLILLEQIYRALEIQKNSSYHK